MMGACMTYKPRQVSTLTCDSKMTVCANCGCLPHQSLTTNEPPEIVRRVLRFAGERRSCVRNPNITAREAIELANWILANCAKGCL